MDRDQLYDGLGVQAFWNLYLIDQDPGHPWEELQDAPNIIQAGVVTQWAIVQVYIAPARQVAKGGIRAYQAFRGVQRARRTNTPTPKEKKEFDMFAEKYYKFSPRRRLKERRKDLYESSSSMERELLQQMWALEAQSSNFNPAPWILAMFGGAGYVTLWAYIVGYRL